MKTKPGNFPHSFSLKEKDLYDVIEKIGDVSLEDIGPVIAKLRIAAGLSQKELAQLLHTKQSNISRLENGRYYSHSLPQLANTGRVLGIYHMPQAEKRRKADFFTRLTHMIKFDGQKYCLRQAC